MYHSTSKKIRIEKSVGVTHKNKNGTLGVNELILIGVGGIIGAGFFLGAGVPIRTAGPSVLLAFLIAAFVTGHVAGALSSMAIDQPVKGSFMVYTREYIGNFAGFLEGWGYYISSVLVIPSEAVAMSVYTKLWLPAVPSWMTTTVYAFIVVLINAFGVKNFSYVESAMSVIKIAALIGFIVIVGVELFRPTGVLSHGIPFAKMSQGFFTTGARGLFQSMLIVVFSFAGIGVFGTAAAEIQNPRSIDRAAWWTMITLTLLYILSILGLLYIVPWQHISTQKSPFVLVLLSTGIPVVPQVFNAIILIASFSVMAGAVFSANQILFELGRTHEAPSFVLYRSKNGVPYGSLAVTGVGIALIVIVSYLLPANVYTFLISASSFLTFLTWFLILWAFLAWRVKKRDKNIFMSSLTFGKPIVTFMVMLFIVFLSGYSLLSRDQRFGFYAFAALVAAISILYFVFYRQRSYEEGNTGGRT